MDLDEDYYKAICRVCLSCCKDKNMVSLVDTEGKDVLSCYGVAVETFADVEIKSDSLPYMMCQECLKLLKQAIKFKKTCENSDETLKRLVQNIGFSCTQTRELIAQYVLFSHYFSNTYTEHSRDGNKIGKRYSKVPDYTEKNEQNVGTLDVTVIIERMLDKSEIDESLGDDSVDNYDDFKDNQRMEHEVIKENNVNDNEQDADDLINSIEKMLQLDPAAVNSKLKKYPRRTQKRRLKYKQRSMLAIKKSKLDNMSKKLKMSKKNVQCEVCKKVLANWQSHQTHMQRHNGKRFVCELCGKAFAVNAFLQSHQAAVHNCGRFFECTLCGYKAVRKWDLVEHQRVHTGERPYTCEKCGMTFRRRYIWKKHALYHKEKTIQCPMCPCKFHQKGEMRAHYNNIHERLYVYECHVCGVTYAKTVTVRRHLLDKHGIAREKQGKIRRIILGRMCVE